MCDLTYIKCVKHVTSVLYYSYAACSFDSFFCIFAISSIITFFKMITDMLLQSYVQRLLSADEHIVLEENTARNPEFDYDRFELANMDNSQWQTSF